MIILIIAIVVALLIVSLLRSFIVPAVILFGGIMCVMWFEDHTGVCLTDHCAEVRDAARTATEVAK